VKIEFPYPWAEPVEVPDDRLLGVFSPREVEEREPEAAVIERALAHPIGPASPIPDAVRPGDRVLILIDDNTRVTRADAVLPTLLREFHRAGVRDESIEILVALGTHRPMTEDEILAKVGPDIFGRYRIINHDAHDLSALVQLEDTQLGTEVWVNRRLSEADYVIGLGQIVPHRVAGYSGGSKIIQPGVSGEVTTGQTHWASAQFSGAEILGVADNPVRREMDAVARRAGLTAIFNVIQDARKRIIGAVFGDPVAAHRAGCEVSFDVYGVRMPRLADIVLIDSYPADVDMWQAGKGIYSSELAVRQGGVVILVTPCPEGVSPTHPQVLEFGYRGYEEVRVLVESGVITDLTVAAHLVHVGRVTADRATCIIVSPGITEDMARGLHLRHANSAQNALREAFAQVGSGAEVAVLKHGGDILAIGGE
jgi:nickel-dependent lactate racemase